jgi:hypothetical protein
MFPPTDRHRILYPAAHQHPVPRNRSEVFLNTASIAGRVSYYTNSGHVKSLPAVADANSIVGREYNFFPTHAALADACMSVYRSSRLLPFSIFPFDFRL